MPIDDKYLLELDPAVLMTMADPPPTPDRCRDEIRHNLEIIEGKPVGLILLQMIAAWGRWVRVTPFRPTEPALAHSCNAFTGATQQKSSATGNTLYAIVQASLDRFAPGTSCGKRRRRGGVGEAHEVLFHELVHAFRALTRTETHLPLDGGLKDFEDSEEFYAILVENIYASANGKTKLRAASIRHTLGHHLDGSFEFYRMGRQVYPLIKDFWESNFDLCLNLADVKARFNPIRAYQEDADKCRRISEGATAAYRDRHHG